MQTDTASIELLYNCGATTNLQHNLRCLERHLIVYILLWDFLSSFIRVRRSTKCTQCTATESTPAYFSTHSIYNLQSTVNSLQSTIYKANRIYKLYRLYKVYRSLLHLHSLHDYTHYIFFLFSIHILYCLYESTHSTKSTHSKKATLLPLIVAFKTVPSCTFVWITSSFYLICFYNFVLRVNIHSSIHHPPFNTYFYYSC